MDKIWETVYKPLVQKILESPDRTRLILHFEKVAQALLHTEEYKVRNDPNDTSKRIVTTKSQGKDWEKSYTEPALVRSLLDRWRKENGDLEELARVMKDFGLGHISESIQASSPPESETQHSSKVSGPSYSNSPQSTSGTWQIPSSTLALSQSTMPDTTTGRKVGNGTITLYQDKVLGLGSNGKVFRGSFGSRNVAVKTINCMPSVGKKVDEEIKILLACDDHPNIVKYYGKEMEEISHANIITNFIAIELCDLTLTEWIEKRGASLHKLGMQGDGFITPIEILHQVSKGLYHLHERANTIIHRDLKPENILLQKMTNGDVRVKLTDFGISRVIPEGHTHATIQTSSGTVGWMAPEFFKLRNMPDADAKMNTKTDIFSLGCVFYYVLTNGKRAIPIPKNATLDSGNYKPEMALNLLTDVSYHNYSKLVRMMMSMKPKQRPSIKSIVRHHIFWDNGRKLQFLSDVSNTCTVKEWDEIEDWLKDNHANIADPSLSKFAEIYSGDEKSEGWLNFVTDGVKADILKRLRNVMKYNGKSVRELVRAIRNFREHYEQKVGIHGEIGAPPDDFLLYWTDKFPYLIDLIWTAVYSQNITKLNQYFQGLDYDFANISNI